MSTDEDPLEQEFVREVRGKARRLSRARRRGGGFWRYAAHVGSLGFVFSLPLVAGAVLGHVLAERMGRPGLAVGLILVGFIAGAFGSWRLIQQSLQEDEE